jgi:hypothetical protein
VDSLLFSLKRLKRFRNPIGCLRLYMINVIIGDYRLLGMLLGRIRRRIWMVNHGDRFLLSWCVLLSILSSTPYSPSPSCVSCFGFLFPTPKFPSIAVDNLASPSPFLHSSSLFFTRLAESSPSISQRSLGSDFVATSSLSVLPSRRPSVSPL